MSIILSVYSRQSFKEFILPSINNADYSLLLTKEHFYIEEDITLKMEVLDSEWRICHDPTYTLQKDGRDYTGKNIVHKDILLLRNLKEEKLSIIVKEEKKVFRSYTKYALPQDGEIIIGSDPHCDIGYNSLKMVSKSHALLRKTAESCVIVNESPNGTYVNSRKIHGEYSLHFGDFINIMGLHMIYLDHMIAIDDHEKNLSINRERLIEYYDGSETFAAITRPKVSEGKRLYHRAPRNYENPQEQTIAIENPPEIKSEEKANLLWETGTVLILLLSMVFYVHFGVISALICAVSGATLWIFHMYREKRSKKQLQLQRRKAYEEYIEGQENTIDELYQDSRKRMLETYPDVMTLLSDQEEDGRLWTRNQNHGDFLSHRLGRGDIPFPLTIQVSKPGFQLHKDELMEEPERIRKRYQKLKYVPVNVDLLKHKMIGIVGGDREDGAVKVAQILSAQIAANNCYTDTKLSFIYNAQDSRNCDAWNYAKWLPHVWSEDRKVRYLASSKEEASEVFYELTKIFRARSEEKKEDSGIPKPYYVVFLSDLSFLEGEPFSKYVFEKDPRCGLTTIFLVDRYEDLPNNCEYILRNDEEFRGIYHIHDRMEDRISLHYDDLDKEKLDTFARFLSGIRVMEMEKGGEIPSDVSFLEMYGVNRPEELMVEDLWRKNRSYDNIRALIGQKAGGSPCYLDVHEKYHGPHGLVAGTTGSGKSELLQTYILSLAVNYSPDDIRFFLIDYKGGGMANLFSGLPHLMGQISNLSGNQVKRAMISIKSENKRRQRIFHEYGVNHIDDYTRMYKEGELAVPLPHLFIVIDEFAELKREAPDFMKELISVAQVGRSLGIHLILATQKPSGNVDDNILSNARFRLCLRVQDKEDSMDMLHKPDAAFLTQAGRCYLQVGNNEVYESFQSAFSGAAYDRESGLEQSTVAALVSRNGKQEIPGIKRGKQGQRDMISQLQAVKEYLSDTAVKNGYSKDLMLWMPPLAERIYLEEFEEFQSRAYRDGVWSDKGEKDELFIHLGRVDDPENQSQFSFSLDFAKSGHVAICGSVVSGKSTAMQTMIYSLIHSYSPERVHVYGLDFSARMLSAFEEAPHVGGLIYENDLDKIKKFFRMMVTILEERKDLLRGGNYNQYIRVNGNVLPAIFIFIDDYASFKEKTKEAYEEMVIRLSKEGISHGIYLVISGGGFGIKDITQRVGNNMGTVLCMNLADRFAYSELLHTHRFDLMPDDKRGRGLALLEGRVLEYQTALAISADNDYERLEKIRESCVKMRESYTGKCARRIPEIPPKAVWSLFEKLEDFEKMAASKDYLPIAYDADKATVYGIPLRETYCYTIWGEGRSGKSNLLKVCVQSALKKKAQVCVIDDDQRTMRIFEHVEGVRYVWDEETIFGFFQDLLPEFVRRNKIKQALLAEDKDDDEIFERMSQEIPYFIVISDLSCFVPLIYKAKKDMRGFLENIIEKGRLHHIYLIGDIAMEQRELVSGYAIYESFVGQRSGVHLGGKVVENPLLNYDYLPFLAQTKAEKAGIGQLPGVTDDTQTSRIVIPLARR